jgi:DNA-binding MarR family transcriptional regulator
MRGLEVTITLNESQIAQVLHEAHVQPQLSMLFTDLRLQALPSPSTRSGHNHALLQALRVLVAFPADGTYKELTDVARQLAIPASTVHRHVTTWTAVGLLEQNPHTRRYRRTVSHTIPRASDDAS